MTSRVDPDLEKILPRLPLRNAATLTPKRARDELVALVASGRNVPLPRAGDGQGHHRRRRRRPDRGATLCDRHDAGADDRLLPWRRLGRR